MLDVPSALPIVAFPEMSAVPPQTSTPVLAPKPPPAVVGPNPPHRRLWLGLKLLVVPFAVVCLPAVVMTYFFGQRPEPKASALPDEAFGALRESLERAARQGLPEGTPPPFGARFEEVSLACLPAETDARLTALRAAAAGHGGTLTEQAADADGRRQLVVELPGDQWPRFRWAALVPPAERPTVPPGPDAAAAQTRVFARVTLAPGPVVAP